MNPFFMAHYLSYYRTYYRTRTVFCSTFSNPFFQELILPSIIRQTAATYQMMAFKIIQQDHVIAFLHSRDFNLIKFQLELLLLLRLTVLYHIIRMSIHTIKQLISIANILLSQQQVNLLDIQLILLRPRKMNPAWILTSATGHPMASILHHGPTHFQPKLTNLKKLYLTHSIFKTQFSSEFLSRIDSAFVYDCVGCLKMTSFE